MLAVEKYVVCTYITNDGLYNVTSSSTVYSIHYIYHIVIRGCSLHMCYDDTCTNDIFSMH